MLTFCPGNIIEEVAVGSQTGTVTWTEPTATDNSGTVIPSSDFSSPLVLNVGDSQTVTYRLSDPSGNFVECIFMVSVVGTLTKWISSFTSKCGRILLVKTQI